MTITEQSNNANVERKLAWVGHYSPLGWHPKFLLFDNIQFLFENSENADLIVLNLQSEQQDKALKQLRGNDRTALSLVFVVQQSPLSDYLANGAWNPGYPIKLEQYTLKKQQITLQINQEISYKLLSYLWLHGNTLKARPVPFAKHLYDYPLLSTWGINEQESFSWLASLQRKAWLERDKLINRVRLCGNCLSGHLNYIDNCPQCASIEIETQSSLHCFNCGHIAKQDDFKKWSVLCCPNCLQTLRHIGVDYDRPIENQHCNQCDSLFIEATVQADCLHCLSHHSPDDLQVRNIYNYNLASAGRGLVRNGIAQLLFELNPGEAMTMSQFSWLVSWQNKLALRHQLAHLIIAVEATNIEQVINEIGEAQAFAQLDALKKRVASVIRTTDVFSRYSQHTLLLFFPMTSFEQRHAIHLKIKGKLSLQSVMQVEVQIKALSLPDNRINEDTLQWLDDELQVVQPL